MAIRRLVLGGLEARQADELVGLEAALDASDCWLDDDTLRGRTGYRKANAAALAGSGLAQGMWRYRTGAGAAASYARAVAVVAGSVYPLTDPSSETLSDGAIGSGTSKFGATAAISGARLGGHLYLSSDESAATMTRMKADWTLQDILQLPQPSLPTKTLSSMSLVKFSACYARTAVGSGAIEDKTSGSEHYYKITRSGGLRCQQGDGVLVQLANGTTADWTGYSHIVVAMSVPKYNKGGGSVQLEIGNGSSAYEVVGSIHDDGAGGDSRGPVVAYFDITGVSSTVRSAVNYLRFTMQGQGIFTVYGYILVAQCPGSGTLKYRTTYYDSTTLQESIPSPELEFTIPEPSAETFTAVKFPIAVSMDSNENDVVVSSFSMDPKTIQPWANGNLRSGMDTPDRSVFGGAPTITQAVASAVQSAGKWRLWRLCSNGWRLIPKFTSGVAEAYTTTWSTTTTSTSAQDNLGPVALGQQSYKAGGTQAQCSAMAARNQRLVLLYENRVWISNYIGAETSSVDPYPQFPAVALEEADGWAFDVSPAKTEIGRALIDGDQLYILTSESVYGMEDLSPNSPCGLVFRRGVVSRQGAIWADDRLYWAAADGIYTAQGRANAGTGPRPVDELTETVRRKYQTWFAPGSAVVLAYQDRKLLAFNGTKYMRLDLVTGRWTTGTLAHAVACAAQWHDPDATVEQCWFLTTDRWVVRWQASATSDAGTSIPDWSYSTGWTGAQVPGRMKAISMLAEGDITCRFWKNGTDYREKVVSGGASLDPQELMGPADLRSYRFKLTFGGANTARVVMVGAEVESLDARGG